LIGSLPAGAAEAGFGAAIIMVRATATKRIMLRSLAVEKF